ncbi:hypothetical protein BC834DRAFT_132130 [Gloeopeniophorella convolvens]|nr:hypothetical protein BC834DRAFT_132130 [Gloeopeniophorella convolvens]
MGAVALWENWRASWGRSDKGARAPRSSTEPCGGDCTSRRASLRHVAVASRSKFCRTRAPGLLCFGSKSYEASHSSIMAQCASASSGKEGNRASCTVLVSSSRQLDYPSTSCKSSSIGCIRALVGWWKAHKRGKLLSCINESS